MNRRRKFSRRRITRLRSNSRRPGYKIAVEVLLVLAVLQGVFFIINNYKKAKPGRVKLVVARPAIVKPQVTMPKAEEPAKPKIMVTKARAPKPEKAVKKPESLIAKPVVTAGAQGKIAIVLDDWGYSLNNIRIVERLNYPFTAAVLPNLRYSKSVAEELRKRGIEIILHLPMESQEKLGMENGTILTSMDEGQIKDIIGRGLDSVLYARGINNHMGSKATSDPRVMEGVFKELKKRGLYFLDSAVTAESVCPELAKRLNISFIERDVFLDNRADPEYIKGQIEKLKAIAKKKDFAVGIGHDRKNTLEVLKEVMPELAEEGYKFVFISELLDYRASQTSLSPAGRGKGEGERRL